VTRQKQYTATASLLFTQSQIGAELLGNTSSSGSTDPARQAETNVRLVESSEVAARVALALHGRLSPLRVARKISAATEGQSDVVAVRAQDPSPQFAAQLANLYVAQFIAFQRITDSGLITQVGDSLTRQLNAMTPAQRGSPTGVSLQTRIEQVDTLAAAQTGNVQVIQPASIPTSASYPKTTTNILIGGSLGLLLGIGLMLFLERLSRRVHGIDELREIYGFIGFPILAEVPESDAFGRDGQVDAVGAYGPDYFDMLRARLRFFNFNNELRSVLVTSGGPQEGKTTVAWHLARATALSAEGRVLLIEADLRRPALAAARGLRATPGLSDVLVGDLDYRDAIAEVGIARARNGPGSERSLDVIVGGVAPPNPAELIESARMKELIRAVTEAYDFVVIDSGPALLVSDPRALMTQVGGVLVVSRVGSTKREAAVQLRDELLAMKAPIVGVVANRVTGALESSYYPNYERGPEDAGR